MKSRLTWFVILAMITGPLFGLLLHQVLGEGPAADNAAAAFSLVTTSFLRLIKMIIAPLVFSTLVVGVARMEGAAAIARIGGKALGWFVIATLISMTIGLAAVQLFKPGLGLSATAAATGASVAAPLQFKEFLDHIIPTSVVQAMANNEILQIVVFSLFFGAAASSLGSKVKRAHRQHRRNRRRHLESDPLRHGAGAHRDLCRACGDRVEPGLERFAGVCEVHRQLLSGADPVVGILRLRFVSQYWTANIAAAAGNPCATAAGFFDLQFRSGVSANIGTPGSLRRQHPHRLFRAAFGIFVQPVRLRDVLFASGCCSSRKSIVST